MANPVRLTSKLLVAPQIGIEDLDALKAVGIKTIICNRPDGETADQPSSQSIAEAAQIRRMNVTQIPVTKNMNFEPDAPEKFSQIVDAASGEVLAYCGTGRRSVNLWALSQREKSDVDEIIRTAAQSGFDLSPMRQRLTHRDAGGTADASSQPAAVAEQSSKPQRGFWARLFGAR